MVPARATMSGGMVAASRYVGRRLDAPGKQTPYESGMDPRGDARDRFSVKFYLVAMLFIVFDIETVFMMPAEQYTYVSSRLVKEVFALGRPVTGLVPEIVEYRLREKRTQARPGALPGLRSEEPS